MLFLLIMIAGCLIGIFCAQVALLTAPYWVSLGEDVTRPFVDWNNKRKWSKFWAGLDANEYAEWMEQARLWEEVRKRLCNPGLYLSPRVDATDTDAETGA